MDFILIALKAKNRLSKMDKIEVDIKLKPLDDVAFSELVAVRDESRRRRSGMWVFFIPPYNYPSDVDMARMKKEELRHYALEEAIETEIKKRIDSYFIL